MQSIEYVFDLEADNLLDDVTTVHCIVLMQGDKVISFTPEKIQDGLSCFDLLAGPNPFEKICCAWPAFSLKLEIVSIYLTKYALKPCVHQVNLVSCSC